MSRFFYPVWRVLRIVGDIIWDMRAALLVAIATFVIFWFPGQTREIYRVLALDIVDAPYRPILSLLALALLSYFLWALSRALWVNARRSEPGVPVTRTANVLSHLFSLLVALLPILAVVLSLLPSDPLTSLKVMAEVGIPQEADKDILGTKFSLVSQDIIQSLRGTDGFPQYIAEIVDDQNRINLYSLILLEAVVVLFAVMLVFLLWRSARGPSRFINSPFAARYFWPVLFGVAAVIALIAAQPFLRFVGGSLLVTKVLTGAGAFVIICFFLLSLAYLLAGSTRLYDTVGIPLISFLVIAAFVFAYFNWNGNHSVRLQEYKGEYQPKDLYEVFLDWYAKRPDSRKKLYTGLPKDQGGKYPVYVVAAQGGGVYAANLAALTLARLYTRCPALRHHVFAISGVSGGSLGASAFSAFWARARMDGTLDGVDSERCQLEALGKQRIGDLEKDLRAYLSHDFLSPVLAGALFPDFLQRFIVPGFGALDRARAFEASLAHAWIDVTRDQQPQQKAGSDRRHNPFRRSFLQFSQELQQDRVEGPMLVLNTTSVETGQRHVIAPVLADPSLPIEFVYPITAPGKDGVASPHDISLATAVGLSARFPIILPPGTYPRQISPFHFSSLNLVDGGYFESSAIETAIDLVNGIKRRLPKDLDIEPEFRIIILNEDYSEELGPGSLTEFGAPVVTLNEARRRRGQLAKWRVKSGLEFDRFYAIELQHDYFYMPLGWHLSKTTQSMIGAQIGFPDECRIPAYTPDETTTAIFGRSPSFRTFMQLVNRLNNNRCSLADIINELEPPKAAAAGF